MPTAPRVLFVHAHPDDETINNGVTIAQCVARGAQVTVLTCTLGEEGEVIGDRWAGLAVDRADQLGGYRIGELTAALRALGVDEPRFLGGAGRWRDSGMPGTASRGTTTFVDADFDALVAELADEIARLRPHVVVTYDPDGGYGHPDHIQAHRVTTAAIAAAAARWRVPKFYWTVTAATVFRAGLDALEPADVLPDWIPWPPDATYGYPDDQITAVVDAPEHLPAKIAAMTAHATQMTVGPTGRAFTLSNNVILPVVAAEHFVLVAGLAGEVDEKGWEHDLFAGLELAPQ
ncbi:MAG: N-acetyl-1-D-myo-inositol-2-amino-2-deoxy-alpha-D-glucopyranoside deacetylase [Mycobacterium sp.]